MICIGRILKILKILIVTPDGHLKIPHPWLGQNPPPQSIGKNCYINQCVTIGVNGKHAPIIGDNVRIATGAIVIGKIIIGDNVLIGAGSVVVKDIPNNCTVVGNPARIVKQDGLRVYIR